MGGREVHIEDLTKGLTKRGHEVTILTTKNPKLLNHEKKNGVDIFYYPKSNPRLYTTIFFKDFVDFFEVINKTKKFDIIHDQNSLLGHSYIFYSKNNLPAVITFHGTYYDELNSRFNVIRSNVASVTKIKSFLSIFKILFGLVQLLIIIKKFDGFIATSNEEVGKIKKYHLIPDDKIYKVYNGVDTGEFKPAFGSAVRQKFGLNREKVILTVSKIEEQKGIQNMILALPEIVKEMKDVKLMVVGSGSYMKHLETLVKKLNVSNYIIFTGTVPIERLPDYFNACDLFVNPTIRQNGYDLTILEAMACEKPVVVSNIGSVPTVIEDGVGGLLVPPGDIKKLAEAVIKVLSDKELAERLGKAARKKVVEKFSVESMVEGTIKVYEEVIRRNKEELKK